MEEYYNIINGNLTVNVLFAGREHCLPANRPFTMRTHYLFHYVLAGKGEVAVKNVQEQCSAGSGFIFFPNERGRYWPDDVAPWYYAWIGFTGREAPHLLARIGVDRTHPVFHAALSDEVASLMHALVDTLKAKKNGSDIAAEGTFLRILGALAAVNGAHVPAGKRRFDEHVENAISFIATNYQRDIGASDAAEYTGLETSYLSKLMKERTGRTLQEHLISVRIERAKLLLKNTKCTVHEVSQSVGYDDYFTFAKCFKRETGCTPTGFREKMFY